MIINTLNKNIIRAKLKRKISDILDIKILEAKFLFNKSAIVVYQMGKVGSTTVYSSLEKQLLFTPVFHVHCLARAELKKQEESYQAIGKLPSQVKHLRHGNFLRQKLDESAVIEWKIITLVRDPIIREISIFFQQKDHDFPKGIETSKIINILQNRLASFQESNDFVCNWFDRELKHNFAINIYDFAFDKKKGYHIISEENKKILLIRLENLNDCFQTSLEEFLETNKTIGISSRNVARKKQYKEQYLEVIEKIKIPRDVCELIYSSNYARHFYSDEMLHNFIRRWTK